MTSEECLALVTQLCDCYPRDVKETTLEAYANALVDLPLETAQRACRDLIRTSKWLPAISEIREAEATLRMPEMPSVDAAWTEAIAILSRSGCAKGSPYVSRALALLGRSSDLREEQLHWIRPRFFAAYERITEQVRETTAAGYVPEWLEDAMIALPVGDVPLRLR